MKRHHYFIFFLMFFFTACTQRGCQSCNRDFQFSERYYHVTLFSGGKAVKQWTFKGIINQEEHTNGIFWYENDKLIEVNGDYVVESTQNAQANSDFIIRDTLFTK